MHLVTTLRALGVTASIAAVAFGVSAVSSADPPALGGPAVDACHDLGGNVQAGTICHARVENDAYLIDMRFGVDYPDAQPVIDYLYRQRDALVNATQARDAQNLPYQMSMTVQSFESGQPLRVVPSLGQQFPGAQAYGEPWRGTQTMVLKVFERRDLEKSVPRTRYKTFTFDHDKNRAVTFNDLFPPGSKALEAIYPYMAADLEKQQLARHFKLSPKDGLDPALYQNFAITDDAIIIFVDQGRLFPDESGDTTVAIPRNAIPPLQI